jgi:hypothetical protein
VTGALWRYLNSINLFMLVLRLAGVRFASNPENQDAGDWAAPACDLFVETTIGKSDTVEGGIMTALWVPPVKAFTHSLM